MKHRGSISGVGVVTVEGVEVGKVDYDISVTDDGHFKEGRGRLVGDFLLLSKAFNADSASLILERGVAVRFLVEHLSEDGAAIVISGPVPGF